MEEVLKELARPVWWISVVVAGIIINLIASYMKGGVDRSMSATSTWWQQRSVKRQEDWAQYIDALAASEEARSYACHLEIRARLQSIIFLLFAVLFALIAMLFTVVTKGISPWLSIAMLAASTLIMFVSYLSFLEGFRRGRAVRLAQLKANNSFKPKPLRGSA